MRQGGTPSWVLTLPLHNVDRQRLLKSVPSGLLHSPHPSRSPVQGVNGSRGT